MPESSGKKVDRRRGLVKSLLYFDEVARMERQAINGRRRLRSENKRGDIASNPKVHEEVEDPGFEGGAKRIMRFRFIDRSSTLQEGLSQRDYEAIEEDALERASAPDPKRSRPKPEPSDTNGLALSGGGIRSAAFCLGVMQSLNARNMLLGFDYLSTVSGGGYIGASVSAALNAYDSPTFPFSTGGREDVRDADSVGHLRNFSNYLFPRNRSVFRNVVEAAVIVARGILANIVLVLPFFMAFLLLTALAYGETFEMENLSYITAVMNGLIGMVWHPSNDQIPGINNMLATAILLAIVSVSAATTHRKTISANIISMFFGSLYLIGLLIWLFEPFFHLVRSL